MQVLKSCDVNIYLLNSDAAIPEWLSTEKKKALIKNNLRLRQRIDLIRDFVMPDFCSDIQITDDGAYVLAVGGWKPRIRCFELSQASQKFERCFDSEVVRFCPLTTDFSKIVFLQTDRYVEFHVRHGRHYRTRLPFFARDCAYMKSSADLYFVGNSPEIHRINLQAGKFLRPLATQSSSFNVCTFNNEVDIFACGSPDGLVEFWDGRARQSIACLEICQSGITALKFEGSTKFAVGTSNGLVRLYDIRNIKPYCIKDHNYEFPINKIDFMPDADCGPVVASSDSKCVRIWSESDGASRAIFETDVGVNGLCVADKKSGLFFVPTNSSKIYTFFVPSIGRAPHWCCYLDNIVEELRESGEDKKAVIYDNYKFVTKEELEELGLSHFIGTQVLRSYMHGFFIDFRMYSKAKEVNDYEKLKRKERLKKTVQATECDENKSKESATVTSSFPDKIDPRFAALLTDPDFAVNEESEEFRLIKPVVKLAKTKDNANNESSEEEDAEMWKEVKKAHRDIEEKKKKKEKVLSFEHVDSSNFKKTFASRLKELNVDAAEKFANANGNMSWTFEPSNANKERKLVSNNKQKRIIRSAKSIERTFKGARKYRRR